MPPLGLSGLGAMTCSTDRRTSEETDEAVARQLELVHRLPNRAVHG
jgi:hypothetical protein